MNLTKSSCILSLLLASVAGELHHVLVGNFGTDYNVTLMLDGTQNVGNGYIYTFEIDSDTGTLALVNTTNAASAHPWLSYDVRLHSPENIVSMLNFSEESQGRVCIWVVQPYSRSTHLFSIRTAERFHSTSSKHCSVLRY